MTIKKIYSLLLILSSCLCILFSSSIVPLAQELDVYTMDNLNGITFFGCYDFSFHVQKEDIGVFFRPLDTANWETKQNGIMSFTGGNDYNLSNINGTIVNGKVNLKEAKKFNGHANNLTLTTKVAFPTYTGNLSSWKATELPYMSTSTPKHFNSFTWECNLNTNSSLIFYGDFQTFRDLNNVFTVHKLYPNNEIKINKSYSYFGTLSELSLYVIEFDKPKGANGNLFTLDFKYFSENTKIIPVYAGERDKMPESVKSLIGQGVAGLVEHGNDSSKESQQALSNTNDQLQSEVTNLDNFDKQVTGDFKKHTDAINTNLKPSSKYLVSARWVSNQFEYIVNTYPPVKYMVMFSLVLGISLTVIGRKKF